MTDMSNRSANSNIDSTERIRMIMEYIPSDYFFKPSTMRQESGSESIALLRYHITSTAVARGHEQLVNTGQISTFMKWV